MGFEPWWGLFSSLMVLGHYVKHMSCTSWSGVESSKTAYQHNMSYSGLSQHVIDSTFITECCCCCCRPHSTNVLPAESSTRNHVAASSLSPQVARKGSTLSGFVQRSRLEREVGRDLHSNKWEEVWSCIRQSGQSGEGCRGSPMEKRYAYITECYHLV